MSLLRSACKMQPQCYNLNFDDNVVAKVEEKNVQTLFVAAFSLYVNPTKYCI